MKNLSSPRVQKPLLFWTQLAALDGYEWASTRLSKEKQGGFIFYSIVINGNITITFFKAKGDAIKVAIDAPKDVSIVRGEVAERNQEQEAKIAFLNS